jgi:hypothetical protein
LPTNAYEQVRDRVTEILAENKNANGYVSKSGAELIATIRSEINEGTLQLQIVDATIYQYINRAANFDEIAPFVSNGPHRGYVYDETIAATLEEQEVEEGAVAPVEEAGPPPPKERDLYSLLKFWLIGRNYVAEDVSSLKSGGKWGNPDVIGVIRTELLGCVQIEVASCEVKLGTENWKQFIFEAISHKRFANRSWYCFRTAKEESLPKEMAEYAERFKIGIIQIVLDDAQFADLKNSNDDAKYIDQVDEKIPAIFEHVSLAEQKEVVERAKIGLGLVRPD